MDGHAYANRPRFAPRLGGQRPLSGQGSGHGIWGGAERIKAAYNRALADGRRTRDLDGDLGTEAFVEALVERLER